MSSIQTKEATFGNKIEVENSGIGNQYSVAADMKDSNLPEDFIKHFLKSYEC